ncbi:hypothetical protein SAMN05443575_2260 [Jatrophihabitans endophyticus]|uniref:Uncharacterized protein n=1 Tax=Jatrophihabitans endophyticus TaxID=1206085 RepID=A0A1M5KVT2_9ACTN|nr:hypothetical protein [Jatrophihabitans endophyticus]SHG56263.1 hypothetical protein SAMN05443575_2260 [Jatrophihabitans endophyticus]
MTDSELAELVVALRARTDVAALGGAVAELLAAVLPADMVEVARSGSWRERRAGRGRLERVGVTAGERRLVLELAGGTTQGWEHHVVHGVTIARHRRELDDWLRRLAELLYHRARDDERARAALEHFLR